MLFDYSSFKEAGPKLERFRKNVLELNRAASVWMTPVEWLFVYLAEVKRLRNWPEEDVRLLDKFTRDSFRKQIELKFEAFLCGYVNTMDHAHSCYFSKFLHRLKTHSVHGEKFQ